MPAFIDRKGNFVTQLCICLTLSFFGLQAFATIYTYSSSYAPNTPTQVNGGSATGTAIIGALAGALTANHVATNTGNQAAINATQSALINTEASVISTGVTSSLGALVH